MKPHNKARKIIINGEEWHWMLNKNAYKLILWNPQGEKTVHPRDKWTFEMRELFHTNRQRDWDPWNSGPEESVKITPGKIRRFVEETFGI